MYRTGSGLSLLIGIVGIVASVSTVCLARATTADDKLSEAHKELVNAFVQNYRTSTPIAPIPQGSLTEDEAYEIADAFVSELMATEGAVGG